MNKLKRVINVVLGLIYVIAALIIMLIRDEGYLIVLMILAASLLVYSVKQIIYYLTMARYMVGGGIIFVEGVILFDLALLSFLVNSIPQQYVMIYLLFYYVLSGVISILRAVEAAKMHAPGWFFKLIRGIVIILIAIAGMLFSGSAATVSLIYAIGLIYSAVLRFITAFRKEETVLVM
ncbi:MAG: hypothetical protein E7233_10610 [Lachnospiraceae bacterium]|nr:hypothetical protein [Lachnospiraceae bacterium]